MGKSLIIDVPLAKYGLAEEAAARELAKQPEDGAEIRYCVEERPNGRRCPWPAMPGRTRCERHEVWYRDVTVWTGKRYPEGALGVQETLAYTATQLLNDQMAPERARVVAEVCRLMLRNVRQCEREMMEAERNSR